MSELREECYKCLNNQECFSGADYGSIYCARNRRFKMPLNEDYTMKFATMQKQIDNLTAQLANSISKETIREVLQKNRNELLRITYVDEEQYEPFEKQINRINKIGVELLNNN